MKEMRQLSTENDCNVVPSFAIAMKEIRSKHGVSMQKLANILGRNIGYISMLENSYKDNVKQKFKGLKIQFFFNFCFIFNINPNEFYEELKSGKYLK